MSPPPIEIVRDPSKPFSVFGTLLEIVNQTKDMAGKETVITLEGFTPNESRAITTSLLLMYAKVLESMPFGHPAYFQDTVTAIKSHHYANSGDATVRLQMIGTMDVYNDIDKTRISLPNFRTKDLIVQNHSNTFPSYQMEELIRKSGKNIISFPEIAQTNYHAYQFNNQADAEAVVEMLVSMAHASGCQESFTCEHVHENSSNNEGQHSVVISKNAFQAIKATEEDALKEKSRGR